MTRAATNGTLPAAFGQMAWWRFPKAVHNLWRTSALTWVLPTCMFAACAAPHGTREHCELAPDCSAGRTCYRGFCVLSEGQTPREANQGEIAWRPPRSAADAAMTPPSPSFDAAEDGAIGESPASSDQPPQEQTTSSMMTSASAEPATSSTSGAMNAALPGPAKTDAPPPDAPPTGSKPGATSEGSTPTPAPPPAHTPPAAQKPPPAQGPAETPPPANPPVESPPPPAQTPPSSQTDSPPSSTQTPPGAGKLGDSCASAGDCQTGDCLLHQKGGMCTASCRDEGSTAQCPESSVCKAIKDGPRTCLPICRKKKDDACASNTHCVSVSGTGLHACTPR